VPSPVFKFDRFELDVGSYELRRGGQRITLQRVPMDLLILLLERKGALVTREEIAARVWNGDGLVDTQSSINTAVRKIRQALDDDGEQPRFIETVIGKGYRLVSDVATEVPGQETLVEAPAEKEPAAMPGKPRPAWLAFLPVFGAIVVGALVVLFSRRARPKPEPMIIVPFTALAGQQSWPAFSADGNRVAFGWTGPTGDCSHIYVKAIGAPSPTQWTQGPQCQGSPSWSPDGRWLAFLGKEGDNATALYVMPASGGNPRRVAALDGPANYRPAWTPDGHALVVMHANPPDWPPGLFRVELDSGSMRRLIEPEPASTGDWCPLYSPNGRLLAYLHNTGSRRLSSLNVVPVDGSGMPSGPSRRIETGSTGFSDFTWSSDGTSLIGSTPSGLVRVPLAGGTIQPLPFPDGSQPAIAPRGDRMLYMRPLRDTDIFRLPGPRVPGPVTKLISSTRQESAPQYSADGKRIVFISDRTGADEIWVANEDGGGLRQVTSFAGPSVGSPRWSPDGQWIAFDSTAESRPGIYLAAASGGAPRRITSGAISCVRPSWSHDGKWIYFGSNQGGGWDVWKIAPQGGSPVQVTHSGGREAFEAPGGEFLYYAKAPPAVGIWRLSLKTGVEVKFSDAGTQGRWALGGLGIYYMKPPNGLVFMDFAGTWTTPILAEGLQLGHGTSNMLAAAPDDCCVLVSALVRAEDHLILVRNFQ
jgi:Tol biopolymer transport system component/DNA-binding winged helix-turn-helix (wHTH) protein